MIVAVQSVNSFSVLNVPSGLYAHLLVKAAVSKAENKVAVDNKKNKTTKTNFILLCLYMKSCSINASITIQIGKGLGSEVIKKVTYPKKSILITRNKIVV